MPYDNNLRQLWAAAGYRSDMGSAATGRPPLSDQLRLYHLATWEHALSNISKARIKVARLFDLNDPFELMALNFRFGQVRRVVKDFRTTFDTEYGLLCFSEDWTSPVLWSHYAHKHTGVCLGFDVARDLVEKVAYEDERLLPDLGESGDPFGLTPELQTLLRRTKCHQWAYEQEQRMLVRLPDMIQEGNLFFRPFEPGMKLAEVILGHRCNGSLEDLRRMTLPHFPAAKVFKARLAWKFFKVVPQESSVP